MSFNDILVFIPQSTFRIVGVEIIIVWSFMYYVLYSALRNLHSAFELGDRSMVGRRTLTPRIEVRLLVPQPLSFFVFKDFHI